MNKEEFNLSEKIVNATEFMGRADVHNAVPIQDVKEFIKLLKERISFIMSNSDYTEDNIGKVIDELAGDKLI